MTATPPLDAERERVLFLARVVEREASCLADTDRRLFSLPMTPERASSLPTDAMLAERVDAFVTRFARLQDTLVDALNAENTGVPQLSAAAAAMCAEVGRRIATG